MNFLVVLLFITYLSETFQVFDVFRFGVTYFHLALLLFYIAYVKKVLWDGVVLIIPKNLVSFFFASVLISGLLSGIVPLINGSSLLLIQYYKTFFHLIFLACIAFTLYSYPFKPDVWTNVLKIWIILSLFINLFGIYQIVARAFDLPLAWIDVTNVALQSRDIHNQTDSISQLSLKFKGFYRATSIFTEPSGLASFNTYIFILFVIPFIQRKKQFINNKIFNIITFSVCLITLFLTFSLTGFVGVALTIISIIIFEKIKKKTPIILSIFAAILLIIITDLIVESYTKLSVAGLFQQRLKGIMTLGSGRNEATDGESFVERMDNIIVSIDIWEKYPIFGTGLGLYQHNNDKNIRFSILSVTAALAEMGILGLISVCGLFIVIIAYAKKFLNYRNKLCQDNEQLNRLCSILLYLIIPTFVTNFISGNNLVNTNLWIILGMIFSITKYIHISQNKKIFKIVFLNKPLKTYLGLAVNRYLIK